MSAAGPMAPLAGRVRTALAVVWALILATGSAAAERETQPVIGADQLTRFGDLCFGTVASGHDAFADAAEALGFRRIEAPRAPLEAFFEERGRAFAHRGATNEILGDTADFVLAPVGDPEGANAAYFVDDDGWLVALNSPGIAGMANGIPFGKVHQCRFFGYGWIEALHAINTLADLTDDDLVGRDVSAPRKPDWRYLFTTNSAGPYPKPVAQVAAVKGAPDARPTLKLEYALILEMNFPDSVFQNQ